MSPDTQETIALALVSLAAFAAGFHIYKRYLSLPLAEWLLKRGQVKLAMRIHPKFRRRSRSSTTSGDDCCD